MTQEQNNKAPLQPLNSEADADFEVKDMKPDQIKKRQEELMFMKFQQLPDSTWWQHTEHVAAALCLMETCRLSLVSDGN